MRKTGPPSRLLGAGHHIVFAKLRDTQSTELIIIKGYALLEELLYEILQHRLMISWEDLPRLPARVLAQVSLAGSEETEMLKLLKTVAEFRNFLAHSLDPREERKQYEDFLQRFVTRTHEWATANEEQFDWEWRQRGLIDVSWQEPTTENPLSPDRYYQGIASAMVVLFEALCSHGERLIDEGIRRMRMPSDV